MLVRPAGGAHPAVGVGPNLPIVLWPSWPPNHPQTLIVTSTFYIPHMWKHMDDIFWYITAVGMWFKSTPDKNNLFDYYYYYYLTTALIKPQTSSQPTDMPRTLHILSIILSPTSISFFVLFLVQSSCVSLFLCFYLSLPTAYCFHSGFYRFSLSGNLIFIWLWSIPRSALTAGYSYINSTLKIKCAIKGIVQSTHYTN